MRKKLIVAIILASGLGILAESLLDSEKNAIVSISKDLKLVQSEMTNIQTQKALLDTQQNTIQVERSVVLDKEKQKQDEINNLTQFLVQKKAELIKSHKYPAGTTIDDNGVVSLGKETK